MQIQTIKYDSEVDALIAITKRLSSYENRYEVVSEDFFNRYSKGEMEDSTDFVEWSNAYEHFMAIRQKIERRLQNVA